MSTPHLSPDVLGRPQDDEPYGAMVTPRVAATSRVETLRCQTVELQHRVKQLESECSQLASERNSFFQQLVAHQGDLDSARKRIEDLEASLSKYESRAFSAEYERDRLAESLRRADADLDQLRRKESCDDEQRRQAMKALMELSCTTTSASASAARPAPESPVKKSGISAEDLQLRLNSAPVAEDDASEGGEGECEVGTAEVAELAFSCMGEDRVGSANLLLGLLDKRGLFEQSVRFNPAATAVQERYLVSIVQGLVKAVESDCLRPLSAAPTLHSPRSQRSFNVRKALKWLSAFCVLERRACARFGMSAATVRRIPIRRPPESAQDETPLSPHIAAVHSRVPGNCLLTAPQEQFLASLEKYSSDLFCFALSEASLSMDESLLSAMLPSGADGTTISDVVSVMSEVAQSMDDSRLPPEVRCQLWYQICYYCSSTVFNVLMGGPPEMCTCDAGMKVKMALSVLEGWLSNVPSAIQVFSAAFGPLRDAANVLVLDKTMFLDAEATRAACPSLTDAQVSQLLSAFRPRPVSQEIIETVRRRSHRHLRLSQALTLDTNAWPDEASCSW